MLKNLKVAAFNFSLLTVPKYNITCEYKRSTLIQNITKLT